MSQSTDRSGGSGSVQLNPDGYSVKGCSYIYAPKGQAGEYSPLAANPYRGCAHKCSYCLDGNTLIQMADGSTKKLSHVQVGDCVIGIEFAHKGKAWGTRVTSTSVLAKIKSHKQAYKITTADGTQVICSADHRWLTERGWKYTLEGDERRPHLTTGNSIRTLCFATETPEETEMYRRGYLAGMIRGDANLSIYDYSDKRRKSGKTMGVQYRFRLALKDIEGIDRTKQYLNSFGIKTNDFLFDNADRPKLKAIGTTSPERYHAIKALTETVVDQEWERGWVAGIFDAEGSHSGSIIRITNGNEDMLSITERALSSYGFDSTRDVPSGHVEAIRIRGGRDETFRFWQLFNPAITRKFKPGRALRGATRIVSIEPLDTAIEMFDIMTGTENFIANGLVSHNCYVPLVLKMKREEFDAAATPRPAFLHHLIKDATKYQMAGITDQVMLSFTTDPYHPGDNSLTRATIQVLKDHGLGFCTLTKGGRRALRDIDLFRPHRDAFACTLTSVDTNFAKKWERGAAAPADRIAALKEFHEAGIFTWVSLEPVLDTEATMRVIEETHQFVDLFKVGRVNYMNLTKETDWADFTHRVTELLNRLGAKHYIKRDLQPYLPEGYPNPLRVPQFHEGAPEENQMDDPEMAALFGVAAAPAQPVQMSLL